MRFGPRIAIAMAIGLAIGFFTNNMLNGLIFGIGFVLVVIYAMTKQNRASRIDDD